jgi:hypothetical protein
LSTQRYGPATSCIRAVSTSSPRSRTTRGRAGLFRGSYGIEIVHELIVDRQDGSVLLALATSPTRRRVVQLRRAGRYCQVATITR